MAGSPMESRITGIEHDAQEIKKAVERMSGHQVGSQNGNRIYVSGGLGAVAVGVALGAVIMGGAWIASSLNDIHETMRNNEAFIQATYQQAPEIRQRFDEIRKQQESKK